MTLTKHESSGFGDRLFFGGLYVLAGCLLLANIWFVGKDVLGAAAYSSPADAADDTFQFAMLSRSVFIQAALAVTCAVSGMLLIGHRVRESAIVTSAIVVGTVLLTWVFWSRSLVSRLEQGNDLWPYVWHSTYNARELYGATSFGRAAAALLFLPVASVIMLGVVRSVRVLVRARPAKRGA